MAIEILLLALFVAIFAVQQLHEAHESRDRDTARRSEGDAASPDVSAGLESGRPGLRGWMTGRLTGDLAFAAALAVVWAVSPVARPPLAVVGVFACLFLLAVAADRRQPWSRPRLLLQAALVTVAVLGADLELASPGEILPGLIPEFPTWLAVVLTVVAVLVYTHSLKLIGVTEGYACVASLVGFAGLAAAMFLAQDDVHAPVALTPIVALSVCMVYCLGVGPKGHPVRAVINGPGQLSAGFLLAVVGLGLTQAPDFVPPVTVLWCLGLPVLDAITALQRCSALGAGLSQAGAHMLHHLLAARGHSPAGVLSIQVALGLAGAAFGLSLWQLDAPHWVGFVAFACAGLGMRAWSDRAWARIGPRS